MDVFAGLIDRIPEPYRGEMIGMHKATGLPIGEIVMANIVYDVSAFGHKNASKLVIISVLAILRHLRYLFFVNYHISGRV